MNITRFRHQSLIQSFVLTVPLLLLNAGSARALVNGQNASFVIGQPNFTASAAATTASGVNAPVDMTYDSANNRLFVSDSSNNRVLIFDLSGGVTNGMSASYVLGQPNFTSSLPTTSATGMSGPFGLDYDAVQKRLFVADTGNARVLVFDLSSGISNGLAAVHVLGQATMGAKVAVATQAEMASPSGVSYDPIGRRLFVADTFGGRILTYDLSSGITDFMPAAHVLGKPDFTTVYSPFVTASSLGYPASVNIEYAGQRLYVADTTNSRILIYDISGGISDAMPASWVIGQPDFTSNSTAFSQSGMNQPEDLCMDASSQRLFINDYFQHRVLEFDLAGGITNGMKATHVLGEPTWGTTFAWNVPPWTAYKMPSPHNSYFDASHQRLFVSDAGINRILVFADNDLSNTAGTALVCPSATEICGTVEAAEDSTILPNVPIELRDQNGTFKAMTQSDTSGNYSFGPGLMEGQLTHGSTYYVVPAIGRTESASPIEFPVQALTDVGVVANLTIRNVHGKLVFTDTPAGSSILVSKAPYTGAQFPTLNPESAGGYYSVVTKADGTASVAVPKGTYYVTCWLSSTSKGTVSYTRQPSISSLGPVTISPNQTAAPISCVP